MYDDGDDDDDDDDDDNFDEAKHIFHRIILEDFFYFYKFLKLSVKFISGNFNLTFKKQKISKRFRVLYF